MNLLKVTVLLSVGFSAYSQEISRSDTSYYKDKIIHVVEEGQTLYSLLKKYDVAREHFYATNPSVKPNSPLYIGQIVLFDKNGEIHDNIKPVVKESIVKSNDSSKAIKKPLTNHLSTNIHKVQKGETLYAISKQYGFSPQELAQINQLSNYVVQEGTWLKVDKKIPLKYPTTSKISSSKILTASKILPPALKPTETPAPFVEEGLAVVINTRNRAKKSLALHHTLPLGTIVKVTNEASGRTIEAKIVGNLLPNGPDQGVLLKLSPYAFRQLGPTDSKFRAKITYYN